MAFTASGSAAVGSISAPPLVDRGGTRAAAPRGVADLQHVGAAGWLAAAVDGVEALGDAIDDAVVAGAGIDAVVVGAAHEQVVAALAVEPVLIEAAEQRVVARRADQRVVAAAAVERAAGRWRAEFDLEGQVGVEDPLEVAGEMLRLIARSRAEHANTKVSPPR